MKTQPFFFILLGIFCFSISSCYQQRIKKANEALEGTWKIEEVKVTNISINGAPFPDRINRGGDQGELIFYFCEEYDLGGCEVKRILPDGRSFSGEYQAIVSPSKDIEPSLSFTFMVPDGLDSLNWMGGNDYELTEDTLWFYNSYAAGLGGTLEVLLSQKK